MTEPREELRATETAEKDEYPPDTAFGRAASAKEEHLKAAGTQDRVDETDEAPRAAGKAAPVDPGRAADEASEESFPASDPPSSTGSTA